MWTSCEIRTPHRVPTCCSKCKLQPEMMTPLNKGHFQLVPMCPLTGIPVLSSSALSFACIQCLIGMISGQWSHTLPLWLIICLRCSFVVLVTILYLPLCPCYNLSALQFRGTCYNIVSTSLSFLCSILCNDLRS
jgi:hypothetical protein